MPNTPRMQWPYPAENQDPWFDAFESFVQAADATAYAAREDRNMVLMGGGYVNFIAGTGFLRWTAPFEFLSPPTGYLWSLAAGSATLQDGEILFVDLTRAPISNIAVTASVANQLPLTDSAVLLAIRRGTRVYFRNGLLLQDGQDKDLFTGADAPPG